MIRLVTDVTSLFGSRQGRLGALLLLSLVVQVAFWYLGSPGPRLLGGGAERSPASALTTVGWAVGLLLVVPGLAARPLKVPLREIRFGPGDVGFGLRATVPIAVVLVTGMFFAARDPGLQASYPWTGPWLASGWRAVASWTVAYAFFYLAYEFFYRGFLLRGLEPYLGRTAAIWLQTLASVLTHLGKPWLETIAAIPAGLLFALLALRSRSLLYPILLHLLIGLAIDLFSLYHQGLL